MLVLMASMMSVCGFAQKVELDVHAGTNMSGFVSGNASRTQDQEMKLGANLGLGVSLVTKNNLVLSSGIDFMLTGAKHEAMSSLLAPDGSLAVAYPDVNSREIAMQIPLKIGYRLSLGKSVHFTPQIGVYGRYSLCGIDDDITLASGYGKMKWNSLEQHGTGPNALQAYKRWDMGGLVEGKFTFFDRYSATLGYSRGLLEKSSQFEFKNQGFHLSLGYKF